MQDEARIVGNEMADREPLSNDAAANLDSRMGLSARSPISHPLIAIAHDTGNRGLGRRSRK